MATRHVKTGQIAIHQTRLRMSRSLVSVGQQRSVVTHDDTVVPPLKSNLTVDRPAWRKAAYDNESAACNWTAVRQAAGATTLHGWQTDRAQPTTPCQYTTSTTRRVGRWCRRQHKRIGAARSLSVRSCFWEAKNSGIDSGKQKLLFLVTLGLWLICTKMTYKLHRHRREHLKQIWTFVDFHWSVITTHIYSFIINKSFDRPQHNICNTRMLNVVFTQHVNKCQNRVL